MQPEFSRAAVATLIAAIIGSVLDPADASPAQPSQLPPPPGEPPPDALARLSSLLQHFDYRVDQFVEAGIPDRLPAEYRDLRWMLHETMKHQVAFGPAGGQLH